MSRDRVAVVKVGQDVGEAVKKGVDLIGGLKLNANEHVVIKPNICNPKNPYGMVLTDFRIIEAVIKLVQEKTKNVTVVESDNIAGPAEKRMSDSGLLGRLEEMDVEFLNLSREEAETCHVADVELRIPKTVLNADYFINMPKIKTCGHTLVTLSVKNLFGTLQRARKKELHGRLDEVLPYLAKVIRNDLILVDGITAMEGNGPVIGTPRELSLVVVGSNPVVVDSVCCGIMGFAPSEVTHLARAHEQGLGEISLDRIEVVGDGFKEVTPFERPYTLRASLKSIRSMGKVYLSK